MQATPSTQGLPLALALDPLRGSFLWSYRGTDLPVLPQISEP